MKVRQLVPCGSVAGEWASRGLPLPARTIQRPKCLYWQREWGDVPKAITEATAVLKPSKHKSKATASAKPKAPAKKEANKK